MFGGNDDNAQDSGNTGQAQPEDTLNGVNDLAASDSAAPASTPAPAPDASGGFLSAPMPEPPNTPHDDVPPSPSSSSASAPVNDDLLDLKQQALQQLTPLVGHLDQSPEEKFRTTMMLIQASDNQSLLKDAYEAAQQIGDEKAKAQALLDVINEINYFTQKQDDHDV